MKCKLEFCTCNRHGNCVYRGTQLTCMKIAKWAKYNDKKIRGANFGKKVEQ